MASCFEFDKAAARDLRQLTRRDQPLLLSVVTEHIPAILRDPHGAGEGKGGDLAHVRAYNLKVNNVDYRLVYIIDGDVVPFVASGVHDDAYVRAARRLRSAPPRGLPPATAPYTRSGRPRPPRRR